MKILIKRGIATNWNEMNENGQYTKEKIIKLLEIFEPNEETKDEVWAVAVPILVDLVVVNTSLFKEYSIIQRLMANFASKFSKNDVEKIIELYRKQEPTKISMVVDLLYDTHAKVFEEVQNRFIENEEKPECFLRFFIELSKKDPNTVVPLLPKIMKKTSSSFASTTSLTTRVYLSTCLLTNVIYNQKNAISVLQYVDQIYNSYKMCNLKANEDGPLLKRKMIYFLGLLGRALDSDKHVSKILEYLLEILNKLEREYWIDLLQSIHNIVEKNAEVITKEIKEKLNPFAEDLDYNVRKIASLVLEEGKDEVKVDSNREDILAIQVSIYLEIFTYLGNIG